MEGEISSFIKVWLSVLTSLCFCYAIGKMVPKGTKRLIFLLPVVSLFLFLPLKLSSPHLGGVTAFFVAWLGTFKLLLFAFDKGPLTAHTSLPLFVAVACLPIKIQHNQPPKSQLNGQIKENPSSKSHQNGHEKESSSPRKSKEGPVNYAIKGILLAMIVRVYDYSEYMHPKIIMLLYSMHIYFLLEIILAILAAMVRSFSGLELEPQFNEPYLSTSLQDFWGKRWNLMVSSILRPTVYEPTLRFSSTLIGRKWAPIPSVFSTFAVSAIMHELMFYYLGRMTPSGEVTWFFLIHGFCLTAEIAFKKALNGKCQLPWLVTGPLTVVFVLGTGLWLFIPQFTRCKVDVRAFEEYAEVGALLKNASEKVLRLLSAN
ncbi:PREDICTED: acyl-CoA--sterol O-acyltransferase 1 [Theobroma cacao]|uniref:Acyl-CoA--sterol O-acyltransferase 1 n=1 Tax=Theobroma cacao TaxID=3641 RepID=A0AB32VMZ8_THECC|nr:PREDICTED: acyl-CoA--sterol O-acyltransferase 1 [Theobroma cacao]